jgi:hypothetical protein
MGYDQPSRRLFLKAGALTGGGARQAGQREA